MPRPAQRRYPQQLGRPAVTDYRELCDLSLLGRALEGQEPAWRELMRRFRGLIYRCIGKACARHESILTSEDLDEIYAQVWLQLLRNDMKKLRLYDPNRGTKLGSWIGLISINTAYDYLRTCARQPRLDHPEQLPDQVDGSPGPLERVLRRDRLRRIGQLAAEFSPRDQRFMELYYARGLAPIDVARAMNISVKTVYSKKNKIYRRLVALAQAHPAAMAA